MALTSHWRDPACGLIIGVRPASGKKLIRSPLPSLSAWLGKNTINRNAKETQPVATFLQKLWNDESGQDIAEYAVMLAVILVIVVGTIRLIGSNANNVFSNVGSAIK